MTTKNVRPFSIHVLELGIMKNFVYIIQDHSSNQAAIVDPAWEIEKLLMLTKHQGIKITDVLLTHSHHDHTNGLSEIVKACNPSIHLLEVEAQFWEYNLDNPILHHDGDTIQFGNTKIEILHTPGHTPGSACYYLDGHLLTGDTLFVGGCGRCDLAGGNSEQMYHSLKRLATDLPSDTVIHPGHHYAQQPSATLAEQIKTNPVMQFDNVTDFINYRG